MRSACRSISSNWSVAPADDEGFDMRFRTPRCWLRVLADARRRARTLSHASRHWPRTRVPNRPQSQHSMVPVHSWAMAPVVGMGSMPLASRWALQRAHFAVAGQPAVPPRAVPQPAPPSPALQRVYRAGLAALQPRRARNSMPCRQQVHPPAAPRRKGNAERRRTASCCNWHRWCHLIRENHSCQSGHKHASGFRPSRIAARQRRCTTRQRWNCTR